MDFEKKVIVLTGASEGIGREMAKLLAAHSTNLVLAARNIERLNSLESKLKDSNSKILVIKCDITIEQECANLIDKTIDAFGRIDLVINNAGLTCRYLISEAPIAVQKQLMDVNYWGAVQLTKYALPYVIKSKGMMVAISSVIGKVPVPGRSGYSASKHALEAFFETLRMEMFEKDVKVLVIRPSYTATQTRFRALGADGNPQDYSTLDEKLLESADHAAQKILDAIRNEKNGYTLGSKFSGKYALLLYKLFPERMSKIIYKKIKGEKESLF